MDGGVWDHLQEKTFLISLFSVSCLLPALTVLGCSLLSLSGSMFLESNGGRQNSRDVPLKFPSPGYPIIQ